MTLAARVSTRETVSDVLRTMARPGVKLLTGTLTFDTGFPYVGLARRLILHLKVKAPWRVSRCFGLNGFLSWWVGHAIRVFDDAVRGDTRVPSQDSLSGAPCPRPMPDRGCTRRPHAWGNPKSGTAAQGSAPLRLHAWGNRRDSFSCCGRYARRTPAWGNLGRGDACVAPTTRRPHACGSRKPSRSPDVFRASFARVVYRAYRARDVSRPRVGVYGGVRIRDVHHEPRMPARHPCGHGGDPGIRS